MKNFLAMGVLAAGVWTGAANAEGTGIKELRLVYNIEARSRYSVKKCTITRNIFLVGGFALVETTVNGSCVLSTPGDTPGTGIEIPLGKTDKRSVTCKQVQPKKTLFKCSNGNSLHIGNMSYATITYASRASGKLTPNALSLSHQFTSNIVDRTPPGETPQRVFKSFSLQLFDTRITISGNTCKVKKLTQENTGTTFSGEKDPIYTVKGSKCVIVS